MRRFRIALVHVLLLIAAVFLVSGCGRDLEPLTSATPGAASKNNLPDDALVLNLSQAADVKAPFTLKRDATAVASIKLVMPEGVGSTARRGRATLKLEVPDTGRYSVWAHVYWHDSCGNSLTVTTDDAGATLLAEDSLYGTWHWVKAGQVDLAAGAHGVSLLAREDGVAVDQLLFTRNSKFRPVGPVGTDAAQPVVRRFADDFARSPGHGMGRWKTLSGNWRIAFSFDPNRIPNQYALVGDADSGEALALLDQPAWDGCRIAFSLLPRKEGTCGVVFDGNGNKQVALRIGIEVKSTAAQLHLAGAGINISEDIGRAVRLNQWHRVVVERWAWVVRVIVDDRTVLDCFDVPPESGKPGFFVESGAAVFDDVNVEEVLWQADDGRDFKAPWRLGQDAKWYRPREPEATEALIGRGGTIATQWAGMTVRELLLEELPGNAGKCEVRAPGLTPSTRRANLRVFRPSTRPAGKAEDRGHAQATSVELSAAKGEAAIHRVAIRYGEHLPEYFRIGPYHFTKHEIEDPSDYLDFTPEEYQKMESSNVDKLRRERKFMPVLGQSGGNYSPWARHRGRWGLRGGVLRGIGPNAVLRHTQEIAGSCELRLRFLAYRSSFLFEVEVYGGVDPGSRVQVAMGKSSSDSDAGKALGLHIAADKKWHTLNVRATRRTLHAQVDEGAAREMAISPGDGGQVFLKVLAGGVDFDDIEFILDRRGHDGFFYAFDRREPDWWREGAKWIDHGGVTCVLASSWVSLVAPRSEGLLWNKRTIEPDVLVGFTVEENTEWFGWSKHPSHVHYPFDNICVLLAPEYDAKRGYRLEVNSRNHAFTVLYRNGEPVREVRQEWRFPIRYLGGHAPYNPRKNRISLVKRGGLLRAIINGREVLRFEDPEPIDVSRVGIGGYNTHINFSHVEVRPLTGTPSPN